MLGALAGAPHAGGHEVAVAHLQVPGVADAAVAQVVAAFFARLGRDAHGDAGAAVVNVAADDSAGALAVPTAVNEGKVPASARDRFLDELIGWRELSVLFVRHNENYDNWRCAERWARQTLVEHAGDVRSHRYTLAQLERGETGDELWNAAQLEMVRTGWMHNFMRMYWAKKILEWSPDPSSAFDWAVILNDKYQLDGRDPNGYAGIAWAIVGKHDRPWFDRPIFGKVRSMTAASTARKFDSASYIAQNDGRNGHPPFALETGER